MKVQIDDIEIEVAPETSILEAARAAGIRIPTLCYHRDMPATGACGICMVKVKPSGKMVRACSTPAWDGAQIITQDPELVQVRRTVLEMILSTHPNECLTCARNGTCELQDLAQRFGIRRETLQPIVPDIPTDETTAAVVLDPRKCVKCGRCLIACQDKQDVWALSMLERGIDTRISPAGVSLAESPCIRCGQCSAHCPVGAIYEYDQTESVWDALMDPDRFCVVQVAPAVRVSVGEAFGYPAGTNLTGQVYHALRRLGFDAVFDTNFGADVTIIEEASEFAHRVRKDPESLPLITTCCPAWVDFMEKFHGDMIPNFSSCKSPHAIVGTLTKTWYAQQHGIDPDKIFMVSIMPCIAKKYEIGRTRSMYASGHQDVDISLTTREFIRMIQQAGIAFTDLNCMEQPDSPLGEFSGAGLIFGATGGVMEAALRTAHYYLSDSEIDDLEFAPLHTLDGVKELETTVAGQTVRVAVAHGLAHVETVLNRVREARDKGEEPPYHFIEVMACPGGCIGGGGQSWYVNDEIRQKRIEGLLKGDRVREVRRSHQNPAIRQLYDEFIGEPLGEKAHHLLHTSYQPRPQYQR